MTNDKFVYSSEAISKLLGDALKQVNRCHKHPIATVIETADKKYILAVSGAPTGIKHDECARKNYSSGEGLRLCYAVHSERRAISYSAKNGISINGGTIYFSEWFPCAECSKSMIESGLVRLVTPDNYYEDAEKRILVPRLKDKDYNFELSEKLLFEAGLEVIVDPNIRPQC